MIWLFFAISLMNSCSCATTHMWLNAISNCLRANAQHTHKTHTTSLNIKIGCAPSWSEIVVGKKCRVWVRYWAPHRESCLLLNSRTSRALCLDTPELTTHSKSDMQREMKREDTIFRISQTNRGYMFTYIYIHGHRTRTWPFWLNWARTN